MKSEIDIVALLCASEKLDLHGLTKTEAQFELERLLNLVDVQVKAVEIVHGYHNGRTLKNLVRNEFEHPIIKRKIHLDASRTIFELDFQKILPK